MNQFLPYSRKVTEVKEKGKKLGTKAHQNEFCRNEREHEEVASNLHAGKQIVRIELTESRENGTREIETGS